MRDRNRLFILSARRIRSRDGKRCRSVGGRERGASSARTLPTRRVFGLPPRQHPPLLSLLLPTWTVSLHPANPTTSNPAPLDCAPKHLRNSLSAKLLPPSLSPAPANHSALIRRSERRCEGIDQIWTEERRGRKRIRLARRRVGIARHGRTFSRSTSINYWPNQLQHPSSLRLRILPPLSFLLLRLLLRRRSGHGHALARSGRRKAKRRSRNRAECLDSSNGLPPPSLSSTSAQHRPHSSLRRPWLPVHPPTRKTMALDDHSGINSRATRTPLRPLEKRPSRTGRR